MNYTEWCELILTEFGRVCRENSAVRDRGIDESNLEKQVWGDKYVEAVTFAKEQGHSDVLFYGLFDLAKAGLVDDINDSFVKLNRSGRAASADLFALRAAICQTVLPDDVKRTLQIVNRLSEVALPLFSVTTDCSVNAVLCELADEIRDLTENDVIEMLRVLKNRNMVFWDGGDYPDEVRATYSGLVWDKYRDAVTNAEFFDRLLDAGETTSVEFKRELYLDTKDRKAEFVKDVLGLVNTQASGERLLVVGFDDKTHDYHAPPDAAINQNIIEQILARYTLPVVEVKYETVQYRDRGLLGLIAIKRDRRKLPYRPASSFGDKKRVREDQVFVRHGSQTEEALPSELAALEQEAERAKQLALG